MLHPRLRRYLLLVGLALTQGAFGQLHRMHFEHLSTAQGLSNNSISTLLQDSKGFLWMGTYDGLNCYDGYTVRSFAKGQGPNQLSDSHITTLCCDSAGSLWIGTAQNGLMRYRHTTGLFERFEATPDSSYGLPHGHINHLYLDRHQRLWVATDGGLCFLDKTTGRFLRPPSGVWSSAGAHRIKAVFEDKQNQLWCATNNELVRIDTRGKPLFATALPSTVPDPEVVAVVADSEGVLWIGCQNDGLFRYQPSTNTWQHRTSQNGGLAHNSVLSLHLDQHLLWVGTDGGGLCQIDLRTQTLACRQADPTQPKGLTSSSIFSMLIDRQGIFWIGTVRGGLNSWHPYKEKFEHFAQQPGRANTLSSNHILSFLDDSTGNLWVGTDGGGLNRFDQNTQQFYPIPVGGAQGTTDKVIMDMVQDREGHLWLASYFGGLDKYLPGRGVVRNYSFAQKGAQHLPARRLFSLELQNDSILWIGSSGDGLLRLNLRTEHLQHYLPTPDAPHRSVAGLRVPDILIDARQMVWLATYGDGLSVFDPTKQLFTHYRHQPNDSSSLSSNLVFDVHQDKQQRIWVATQDGGLCLFDPQQRNFRRFDHRHGLPNNTVLAIEESPDGTLWLSTNNGLCAFDTNRLQGTAYDMDDGLQERQFLYKSSYTGPDGYLYFGGIQGYNRFRPEHIARNPAQPRIYLTQLAIRQRAIEPQQVVNGRVLLTQSLLETESIRLLHSENNFSIGFVALQYTNPLRNQYQYKLEGFDTQWQNASASQRIASYTNLDPGQYTFIVRASNNDGLWSTQAARLHIEIVPPLWQTLWFRVLLSAAVVAGLVLFYKLRVRQLKSQRENLSRIVHQRTSELRNANKQLEAQKNELQTINQELTQQKEEIQAQKEELSVTLEMVEQHKARIENQNHLIRSSIHYAHTIQQALLPDSHTTSDFRSFVVYRPKDIVSGDFFWFHKVQHGQWAGRRWYFAVVDCTGHGVPGGFMSMIGQRLLSEIVVENGAEDTQEILTELDAKLKRALNQKKTNNIDGMDLVLCRVDSIQADHFDLQFSGAKRPLYIYQKSEAALLQLTGDRKPIGGKYYEKQHFTQQSVRLSHGDILYLSTDGLIDQNSPERKRFGSQRFAELLIEIGSLPLEDQYERIDDIANSFREYEEQRDDITIWGVQL